MSKCAIHEMLHQQWSPCPYCYIDELKAAMIDLAKNIPSVNTNNLKPKTNEVWEAVICEDEFK